jgi:hypothetical protein
MPEETTQTTTDESANNTGEQMATGTEPAIQATQTEKTFTQAEVEEMFKRRLKSAVKSELKKLTTDPADAPNVEELQRQLKDVSEKARVYETSAAIRDHLTEKEKVKPENFRAIEKLVLAEIEYDDDGRVTNLKSAVESVKSYAPALFAQAQAGHINQGTQGKPANPNDMNAFIRQIHAAKN